MAKFASWIILRALDKADFTCFAFFELKKVYNLGFREGRMCWSFELRNLVSFLTEYLDWLWILLVILGFLKGGVQNLVYGFLVYEFLVCDFLVYGEKGKNEFVLPRHMYVSWVEGGLSSKKKRRLQISHA